MRAFAISPGGAAVAGGWFVQPKPAFTMWIAVA